MNSALRVYINIFDAINKYHDVILSCFLNVYVFAKFFESKRFNTEKICKLNFVNITIAIENSSPIK